MNDNNHYVTGYFNQLMMELGISYISDFVYLAVLIIVAISSGMLFSEAMLYILRITTSFNKQLSELYATIKNREPLMEKFTNRKGLLKAKIEQSEENIKNLANIDRNLTAKIRQLHDVQSRYVRTIGEELVGMNCYMALVTNSYVKEYVLKGNRHPLHDDDWANAQIIEIWSTTKDAAILALRNEYSKSQGFVIDKIEQISRK